MVGNLGEWDFDVLYFLWGFYARLGKNYQRVFIILVQNTM
jgi:hypothetical protein